MKIKALIPALVVFLLFSCENNQATSSNETTSTAAPPAEQQAALPEFQNKGHQLVYELMEKVGNYQALSEKKDVRYTYTYQTPDGKKDVSTEQYIFDGELSYGRYEQHERTFPQLEGTIEQGYDGNEYWLKHNGVVLTEEDLLKRVAFNRPTNFYWFTMFQKLLDPGVNYRHLGEKTIEGQVYDVIKVSFEAEDDQPKDIYQLYRNQKTLLVDQFLFTVADFGVMETPFLMKVGYTEVDGLLLPTKRKYKKSTWEAEVSEEPWIDVTWSDINFNNGLTKDDFKK